MMRNKLGLFGIDNKDKFLILDLLTWMHQKKVDYTNTFCHLMNFKIDNNKDYEDNDFQIWKKRWKERLSKNNNTPEKFMKLMRNVNPLVIPRNHKIEEALSKANDGNYDVMNELIKILCKPYTDQKGMSNYQLPSYSNDDYKTFCGT